MSLENQEPVEDVVDPNIGLVPNRTAAVPDDGGATSHHGAAPHPSSVGMDALNLIRGFSMGAAV